MAEVLNIFFNVKFIFLVIIGQLLVLLMSKALVTKLNASKSASEAAKIFMLEFERPADQSASAQNKRAQIAEDVIKRLL